MFSKQEKQISNVDTVIGGATTFEGNLNSDASVRIDGVVTGSVTCKGDVVVGSDGKIEAEVHGRDLTVAGTINGDVHASGSLKIESTGVINGDISMRIFVIDEGGTFTGNSQMITDEQKKSKGKVQEQSEKPAS
ncbi:bactofilin family protein [Alkalibacillus aidingensis]|uniref:bactofilin family protein n=1 Tax=Alkalibacillus aidingensis TaxID=2747607 RepID=UPI0016605F65|nr:polymer-forming cytoskeletal protein [Alkalibacillus aidingensis]